MRKRRAFTLLELLLATALTAMLMGGVAAVVAQLGKSAAAGALSRPGEGSAARADDVDAWVRMLRDDLNNARQVRRCAPNELKLVSYSVLDTGCSELTHRPAVVEYGITEVGGRRWVVRRQAAMDLLTNQNVRRDLVCGGVTRFELVSEGGSARLAARQSAAGDVIWRLRVWTDDGPDPARDVIVTVGGRMGA